MKSKKLIKKRRKKEFFQFTLIVIFSLIVIFNFSHISAIPEGIDDIDPISNETRDRIEEGYMVNISGGYISALNVTATIQNPRWKAFVGWVSGLFTLDDAQGETIYDWDMLTISGNVYATRSDGIIHWTDIGCATTERVEQENIDLGHTNPNDNITATFSETNHDEIYIGGIHLEEDDCNHVLHTYVNSTSQTEGDRVFQEVILSDMDGEEDRSIIYVTVLENRVHGYDGEEYDFQMIVPEVGSPGWTGATAYYLYVELR